MIITLGGRCGSGKSTISKMLAEHLGYEIISIGNMKRALAEEMGLTILEFDKLGWEDPEKAREFDLKYEEYQQSLPLESKVILDSRLSFYCQPNAFKVFLTVSDSVGAERIYSEQRSSDASASLDAVLCANQERHQGQQDAYMRLYGVDIFDMNNYTLVVDGSNKTPQEVFEEIIEHFTIFLNK